MISLACVATRTWVSSNEYWYAVCTEQTVLFLFAYSIRWPAFMCQTKCTLQTIMRPQECRVSLSESCWTTATYFKRRTNLQSGGLYRGKINDCRNHSCKHSMLWYIHLFSVFVCGSTLLCLHEGKKHRKDQLWGRGDLCKVVSKTVLFIILY